jgi:hypothetical protein
MMEPNPWRNLKSPLNVKLDSGRLSFLMVPRFLHNPPTYCLGYSVPLLRVVRIRAALVTWTKMEVRAGPEGMGSNL